MSIVVISGHRMRDARIDKTVAIWNCDKVVLYPVFQTDQRDIVLNLGKSIFFYIKAINALYCGGTQVVKML